MLLFSRGLLLGALDKVEAQQGFESNNGRAVSYLHYYFCCNILKPGDDSWSSLLSFSCGEITGIGSIHVFRLVIPDPTRPHDQDTSGLFVPTHGHTATAVAFIKHELAYSIVTRTYRSAAEVQFCIFVMFAGDPTGNRQCFGLVLVIHFHHMVVEIP